MKVIPPAEPPTEEPLPVLFIVTLPFVLLSVILEPAVISLTFQPVIVVGVTVEAVSVATPDIF